MSTIGKRLPLADAQHIAGAIYGQLAPSCVRLEIAGSIRRRRPDVGDAELVAIPRFIEEPSGLFETQQVSLLDRALAREERDQVLERISGGDRYVKLRHVRSGLQVDLFIVLPPAQFGCILAIRTGPAEFSHWFAGLVRRQGNHIAGGALRLGLRDHSTPAEKVCTCPVIPTPEERDFFAALGGRYLEPSERRAP